MRSRKYLDYILNPFDLLRTKDVLRVNPTITPDRPAPEVVKFSITEFDKDDAHSFTVDRVEDVFPFLHTPQMSWINIEGLRKADVEQICAHYGIHQLITEDILSMNQRPKMDEINGLVFCLLNMLFYNDTNNTV